jgi:hypothetical protein
MFTDLIQVGFEAIPFYRWPVTVREGREDRNHGALGAGP